MMTDETALRAEMIATCRRMGASGLNQGTSGNLSVRHGAGMLITPSSMPYERMTPEDIVALSFDGTATGGRPSSEWRFHRDIMAARPETGAVLHCHAVHATALACHGRGIPNFHYMTAVAGGDIRCAPYATFGTQALSDAAVDALTDRRACLLGHHGMIAIGADPAGALALAIEVETLARIYLAASVLGDPAVLPEAEMERVGAAMRRLSYGGDA